MSGKRTCFMGRGSRRSQGQHMQLSQLSNPCTSMLLHRGAVPQGLPTTLKYNNKVSGSDTLQKSQGLVPDSISRSVGPCRQSQSDLDMEKPFIHSAALCTPRLYTSIYQSRTIKAGSHLQSGCHEKFPSLVGLE